MLLHGIIQAINCSINVCQQFVIRGQQNIFVVYLLIMEFK